MGLPRFGLDSVHDSMIHDFESPRTTVLLPRLGYSKLRREQPKEALTAISDIQCANLVIDYKFYLKFLP